VSNDAGGDARVLIPAPNAFFENANPDRRQTSKHEVRVFEVKVLLS
jgi:hypothetical protein